MGGEQIYLHMNMRRLLFSHSNLFHLAFERDLENRDVEQPNDRKMTDDGRSVDVVQLI